MSNSNLVKCAHCGHRQPRSETRKVENPNSFTADNVCKDEVECAKRWDARSALTTWRALETIS